MPATGSYFPLSAAVSYMRKMEYSSRSLLTAPGLQLMVFVSDFMESSVYKMQGNDKNACPGVLETKMLSSIVTFLQFTIK